MAKYRKKPVEIEAVQISEDSDGKPFLYECPAWLTEAILDDRVSKAADEAALDVETGHGVARAYIGDYVVRDVEGELYPCKKSVFESTYEVAKPQYPTVPRTPTTPGLGEKAPWDLPQRGGVIMCDREREKPNVMLGSDGHLYPT